MHLLQAIVLIGASAVLVAGFAEVQVTSYKSPPSCGFGKIDSGSYVKIGKNYYEIVKNKVNWIDALSDCALRGAQLATIDSMEELDAINDYLKAANMADWIWVASFDELSVGNFRWIANGQSILPDMWSVGQPDYPQSEHCVHLWPMGPNNTFRLNNWVCSQKAYYLCQKRAPKGLAITVWP